ncbi:putative scavenger receptor cysteine-rich domain-containing group B protein [Apostichopus japonicus]|uniref:Putative scavenger receptor cysteine-rich domain-containing group B protein n=1 Tax=Stichopus japonicus TaxID=307972 RepID=A0A2G8LN06_STIJA|nr:putative scavenger receptor cysteine-rich domain-containing group B protein [Apostichopus japonicus]
MKMPPSYVASWDIVGIPFTAEHCLVKDLGQYWVILVATEQMVLEDCYFSNWATSSCSHSEDAALTCTPFEESPVEGSLKLVDGYSVYSGRIEIYHNGEWGTICDDDWDEDDAHVACRQLGYPTVEAMVVAPTMVTDMASAYYGESMARSWSYLLDDVRCDGSEYMLTQCGHNGWYQHNCGHGEDAWVTCQIPETSLQTGTIAGIVIACAIVAVLIGIGLVVTYRLFKKNRGRVRTQPNIAVISGVDTPAGPPAPRHNWTNVAAPPSYNDVVNNHAYYPQHVGCGPNNTRIVPSSIKPRNVNTQQAPTVHPPPNPDFLIPYPVETSSVTTQPANPFQVQAGQFPSDNVPLMLSSQNQPAT